MLKILSIESIHHVEMVVGVYALCFTSPSSDHSIREMLRMPGVFGVIGTDRASNEVVGFAVCRLVVDEAEILSIGVPPERRRLGWGRELLSALLTEAKMRGASTAVLEVAECNEPAQSLYRVFGFVRVGRQEDYYESKEGRRIAADIMRCMLHV